MKETIKNSPFPTNLNLFQILYVNYIDMVQSANYNYNHERYIHNKTDSFGYRRTNQNWGVGE